jgi:hypothetical protein
MQLYPGDTNMLGWTVTGTSGLDLSWIGSNNDLGLSAPVGGYFINVAGYHNSVPYDGVSQTVQTVPGQTYYVSFEIGYSATYDAAGLPAVGVTVSGAAGTIVSNNFVASGTAAWQFFQFAFMASSSSTILAFTGTTPVNVHYIGLANVIVWSAASEPIVMSAPSVENGQLQLPFPRGGPGTTFELQQASNPAGPWTTAQGTTMTISADGTMGTFMIPIGRITQFYRVYSH